MTENTPKRGSQDAPVDLTRPLDCQTPLLEWFYAQSQAGRWGLPQERFASALQRSAKKGLTPETVTPQKLEQYLRGLHLEDLALATACAEGVEDAWEHFFTTYRGYFPTPAAAILRSKPVSAQPSYPPDSLFSELYGLAGGSGAA